MNATKISKYQTRFKSINNIDNEDNPCVIGTIVNITLQISSITLYIVEPYEITEPEY